MRMQRREEERDYSVFYYYLYFLDYVPARNSFRARSVQREYQPVSNINNNNKDGYSIWHKN